MYVLVISCEYWCTICFFFCGRQLVFYDQVDQFCGFYYMQRPCNWYCQNVNRRLKLLISAKKAIPLSESMFCLYINMCRTLVFFLFWFLLYIKLFQIWINADNLAICIKTSRRRLKEALHSPHVCLLTTLFAISLRLPVMRLCWKKVIYWRCKFPEKYHACEYCEWTDGATLSG